MSVYDQIFAAAQWLENTPLAVAIAEGAYPFPLLETAHVLGLGTVVGTIAIVDLRLLDLASRSRPVRDLVAETLPYTWAGFGLALVTGALMFISKATEYIANVPFRIKLCVLALAGLNMVAFHFLTYRSVDRWNHGIATPRAARIAGASSLLLWVAVVFLGRWIAFVD